MSWRLGWICKWCNIWFCCEFWRFLWRNKRRPPWNNSHNYAFLQKAFLTSKSYKFERNLMEVRISRLLREITKIAAKNTKSSPNSRAFLTKSPNRILIPASSKSQQILRRIKIELSSGFFIGSDGTRINSRRLFMLTQCWDVILLLSVPHENFASFFPTRFAVMSLEKLFKLSTFFIDA